MPFRLLRFGGYGYLDGDMYFLLAFRNPAKSGTLTALVPLFQNARASTCIGIAFSHDGLRWSPIAPFARCPFRDPRGARALCHPAGLLPADDGTGDVLVYLHNYVPAPDRYGRSSQRPDLVQPPPRKVDRSPHRVGNLPYVH